MYKKLIKAFTHGWGQSKACGGGGVGSMLFTTCIFQMFSNFLSHLCSYYIPFCLAVHNNQAKHKDLLGILSVPGSRGDTKTYEIQSRDF